MSEETQQLDETAKATLDETRESDDGADFDSLFSDDETQEDAPPTREEYNRLLKGTKKLASEIGRLKSQPTKEEEKASPTTTISHQDDDVSELFFNQTKEAELVSDDLRTIAESKYNGSILKAWKGEGWLREKATALEAAKKEDEVNRSKINAPANGTAASRVDVSKIKPDEVNKLTPSQKVEWLNEQVKRERSNAE